MPSEQRSTESKPTGRSARFYAPLESEEDVQAIAQRVAQYCMAGLEREEADKVQVVVQEAKDAE